MHSFRLRLILVLVACVTVVSMASTYFEVLAHKHFLRADLEQRTRGTGLGLQPYLEQMLASGNTGQLAPLLASFRMRTGLMGLAVVDPQNQHMAWDGSAELLRALPPSLAEKALHRGAEQSAFGHSHDVQWLEEVF